MFLQEHLYIFWTIHSTSDFISGFFICMCSAYVCEFLWQWLTSNNFRSAHSFFCIVKMTARNWISHELIERSCADSCCFFLLVRPILRAAVFANLYNCAMDLVENKHTFGKGIADCSSSQHVASLFWTLVVAPTLWMSVTAWCSAQKSVSGMLGLVMSWYNGPST